ncbi:DUF2789 domain-containing protein [Shewanella sp. D64]|uniref:DUF2789 domain-containing protein n=1 Tax=unclassified Shewanella TaxID=196818 RepID=UPI0022BA4B05|nr:MULTISPECIES: DUF2789 domain-containing protein [unclassified Shewanella]MEC4727033.1 DUF2789 domain-containing protein [Shewanella sp. D64]MEC4737772.1 DUF2789 domain-containing protein [Shewanella sp. E94]WBJ93969.1 DUF2789 domain-containing protein [Shewanella sp. MTB7]
MDTTPQDLSHLFDQLGIDSSEENIDKFIADNQIPKNVLISQAVFWSESQKSFLREAIDEDAQWSELIDHLDALIRR